MIASWIDDDGDDGHGVGQPRVVARHAINGIIADFSAYGATNGGKAFVAAHGEMAARRGGPVAAAEGA